MDSNLHARTIASGRYKPIASPPPVVCELLKGLTDSANDHGDEKFTPRYEPPCPAKLGR